MGSTLTTPSRAGRATLGAVLMVAGLLAGCGSPEAPPQRTAAATGGTAPAPTSPPAPTATASPPPSATDGTDLTACRDADCEVEVRVGDKLRFNAAIGVDVVTVKSVNNDMITLVLRGSSGGLRIEGTGVSVSGRCTNGTCRDEGQLSVTTTRPGRINKMKLSLVGVDSGRAVLALSPR